MPAMRVCAAACAPSAGASAGSRRRSAQRIAGRRVAVSVPMAAMLLGLAGVGLEQTIAARAIRSARLDARVGFLARAPRRAPAARWRRAT